VRQDGHTGRTTRIWRELAADVDAEARVQMRRVAAGDGSTTAVTGQIDRPRWAAAAVPCPALADPGEFTGANPAPTVLAS
jgi:hypothetical protein